MSDSNNTVIIAAAGAAAALLLGGYAIVKTIKNRAKKNEDDASVLKAAETLLNDKNAKKNAKWRDLKLAYTAAVAEKTEDAILAMRLAMADYIAA